ncbi:Centromere protein C [Podila clonocystis]|nr:Centromere protein C [Podila clonocystis]
MYYFPDEDDALADNNGIGQLGIEYDEAVVAEMMAERRKAVGSEGIKAAVSITSASSPRIKMLKAQRQNLHTTSRIDRLEGSSCHSSPRALASQTASRQPTPNADHSRIAEFSGYSKQNESSIPAATSKVPTSCFDTVTMDHAPNGKGPTTVLVMDKGADSNQYAEVDHSMDSAAVSNELNAKANDTTKSTPKLKVEPAGISSKQSTAVAVDSIAQKKSKKPNVRRSRRTRLPPLDYWRNERAVYEQSKTTPDAGRVIKGVIRPSEEPSEEEEMPPRKKLRTGKTRTDPQLRSDQSNIKETQDAIDSCDADDEHESISQSGFEEEPRIEGQVVDPVTGSVIVRALAESKDTMSRFKAIPESGYKHHMGLAFGELSSGVMKIEPDHEKPNRLAHAGTVIFYVTKGRVTATINNSTFVVTAGGQFMVPRGNQYSIKNVSREDSIIFYARVKAHDAEPVTVPGKRKDGKKKGNTEISVKETKPGNKKQLPPPSLEPSPEVSSQSSAEPVAIDTRNSSSTKKGAKFQK